MPAVNPLHGHLHVHVFPTAEEAKAAGFNYSERDDFKPIQVTDVVVVQNGTEEGRSTVDFVLEDESGQKFAFMVTGRLLRAIPVGDVS